MIEILFINPIKDKDDISLMSWAVLEKDICLAKINEKDIGHTPLVWACKRGNLEVVKILLEKKAAINEKNILGNITVSSLS